MIATTMNHVLVPALAPTVEESAGVWGPLVEPLQAIGFALIPLGLAVALIVGWFFFADQRAQGFSQQTLRTVLMGGALVLLAPAAFLMVGDWMPEPGDVVPVQAAAPSEPEPQEAVEEGDWCKDAREWHREQFFPKEDELYERYKNRRGMNDAEARQAAKNMIQAWEELQPGQCLDTNMAPVGPDHIYTPDEDAEE